MTRALVLLLTAAALLSPPPARAQSVGQLFKRVNPSVVVILKVQGVQITEDTRYEEMQARLSRLQSGAVVTVTVLREGRQIELSARVP